MGRLSSAVFVFVALMACTEDNFPQGLYDYQVVRLLGGDSTKTWQLHSVNQQICDSTYFYQMGNFEDSVSVSAIKWNCQQESYSDTVFVGFAVPSALGLNFSDSLIYDENNYWIVNRLTSRDIVVRMFPDEGSYSLMTAE